MRVPIVIALLVGVAFLIPFVLTDLARELSRHSFLSPPDLDSSDDWDLTADELTDTAPQMVYSTERQAASRYPGYEVAPARSINAFMTVPSSRSVI
jgi:hypothetical protein